MKKSVTVVGAGLAGAEAAWQIANKGVLVQLIEMKPEKKTPAHQYKGFGELVCSNSLRADRLENAVGLLKEEMRRLDSLVLAAADATRVPAGGALAVDRYAFSDYMTKRLAEHPAIQIEHREVTDLEELEGLTVIATGPLTTDALADSILKKTGQETLHFFDAAAPIVTGESVDMDKAFWASRYERGKDYLNCPMTKEEYARFLRALLEAECVEAHGFEEGNVFEGCMPVEVMAGRGEQTLLFGPLKPVGLTNPHTGQEPYAVVQLRKEDREGRLFNLVGFQTHLKWPEQKRVFSLIPGLEQAEFVRFGVMHRNTYLKSPGLLDACYRLIKDPRFFFAGQMTGVEGYVESAASGLVAGLAAAHTALGKEPIVFSDATALGALASYISASPSADFQPMNVNFGIMRPADKRFRKKQEKNAYLAKRALEEIEQKAEELRK